VRGMFIVNTLLPVFMTTILPVFLVSGTGYLLAWAMPLDGRSIGRMLFYLATPSLVFRSLYQTQLDPASLQQLAGVSATVTLLAAAVGWLISFDQPRRERAAIILTSGVSNNGNMGIPISFFAFGAPGLALGTIYYVVSSFLNNTLGVVVASAGKTPLREALRKSVQVPVLYAAVAGLLLNQTGLVIPDSLFRAVDLLANAAIPGMLVLLGMQLRSAPRFRGESIVWRSTVVRLLVGPMLAWLLCLGLGITGMEYRVLVLQAAMPTAVMAAVLATEYDTAPALVATVIVVTTLLSMVSLSLILWLLL
jgi:malate permease and related proteins